MLKLKVNLYFVIVGQSNLKADPHSKLKVPFIPFPTLAPNIIEQGFFSLPQFLPRPQHPPGT